jgi:hypothetical protein
METLHAIFHWVGNLLGFAVRGGVALVVLLIAAFTAVTWFALIVLPIFAPLFKDRSPFKKAKGTSKGPINPYANQPCPPAKSERRQ